jgi:hypothetical protein
LENTVVRGYFTDIFDCRLKLSSLLTSRLPLTKAHKDQRLRRVYHNASHNPLGMICKEIFRNHSPKLIQREIYRVFRNHRIKLHQVFRLLFRSK